MVLAQRGLRALDDVGKEPAAERQRPMAAVDVAAGPAVDQKEMIAAGPAGNVAYLADFDIAVGAEDEETAIAPDAEPVRRVPVDADMAEGVSGPDQSLAEILEFRMPRIGMIGDPGRDDLSRGAAGKGQELIDWWDAISTRMPP